MALSLSTHLQYSLWPDCSVRVPLTRASRAADASDSALPLPCTNKQLLVSGTVHPFTECNSTTAGYREAAVWPEFITRRGLLLRLLSRNNLGVHFLCLLEPHTFWILLILERTSGPPAAENVAQRGIWTTGVSRSALSASGFSTFCFPMFAVSRRRSGKQCHIWKISWKSLTEIFFFLFKIFSVIFLENVLMQLVIVNSTMWHLVAELLMLCVGLSFKCRWFKWALGVILSCRDWNCFVFFSLTCSLKKHFIAPLLSPVDWKKKKKTKNRNFSWNFPLVWKQPWAMQGSIPSYFRGWHSLCPSEGRQSSGWCHQFCAVLHLFAENCMKPTATRWGVKNSWAVKGPSRTRWVVACNGKNRDGCVAMVAICELCVCKGCAAHLELCTQWNNDAAPDLRPEWQVIWRSAGDQNDPAKRQH